MMVQMEVNEIGGVSPAKVHGIALGGPAIN
jgi:hypothetical protein